MKAEGTAGTPLAVPITPAPNRWSFHTGLAAAFLITGLAGFGPTYFFKPIHSSPPLTLVLHVHAAVFTAWLVLLFLQSTLVASRRIDLHRTLGWVGAALAALMVPLGILTAIEAAHRGVRNHDLGPLAFMVFPIGAVLMFTGFIGAALWKRRQPELHRRLIVLATVSLMTPAVARLPWVDRRAVLAEMLTLGFVVAACLHDWRSRGRVHHVYVWGGLILLLSGPARAAVAHSEAWQTFAGFLVK